MKIIYIVNGLGFSKDMPIGGADKRVAEIGKRLLSLGAEVAVLTTSEGRRLLINEGLAAEFFVTATPGFWRPVWSDSLWGRLLSYFYLTFFSHRSLPVVFPTDIVYASSDNFFDLIPSLLIRRRHLESRLVGIAHHRIGLPWSRRGNFPLNLFLFLSQRFGFFLLRFFNLVLVPKNYEGEGIKKGLKDFAVKEDRLNYFENGVDFDYLRKQPEAQKRFDACFLGGLRPGKGIFDLPFIWSEVIKQRSGATLLVIGGGLEEYQKMLQEKVAAADLTEKIVLAGVLPPETLYSFVKSCRVFISPSYEEGWGIAVLEAMACGLPAIVYDLPGFAAFTDGLIRVNVGDGRRMAGKVVELLADETLLAKQKERGLEVVRKFDWNRIAAEELKILSSLLVTGGKNV